MSETFGERLQSLRQEKGITQIDLARQLCVGRSAISKWELGGGLPQSDRMEKIAAILGVTTARLLEPQQDQKPKFRDTKALRLLRAAERAKLPPQKLPADRKCLGCERVFRSSWIGNRLCGTCGGSRGDADCQRTSAHHG